MNRTQGKGDLGTHSMQDRHQKATYPDSYRGKFLRLDTCLDLVHSFYTYRLYQRNLHHILDKPTRKYCLGYIYILAHKYPLYILYSQSRLYLARTMRLRLNDLNCTCMDVLFYTSKAHVRKILNQSVKPVSL